MPVFGSRRFYSRTTLPLIDGWVFIAAAVALCILGALIDVL
jgi:hypothetical protein